MTTVGALLGLHLAVFFLGIFLARIFLGAGQGTAFFQRGRIGFADIVRFVGLVRCHAGRLVVRRGLRVCLSGLFCRRLRWRPGLLVCPILRPREARLYPATFDRPR